MAKNDDQDARRGLPRDAEGLEHLKRREVDREFLVEDLAWPTGVGQCRCLTTSAGSPRKLLDRMLAQTVTASSTDEILSAAA